MDDVFIANIKGTAHSFEFSLKKEFLNICPNVEEENMFTLLSDFQMAKYLHSESDPAIVRSDGVKEYWLNGNRVYTNE